MISASQPPESVIVQDTVQQFLWPDVGSLSRRPASRHGPAHAGNAWRFRPAAPQVATRVPPRASAAYHSVPPLLHSFCDPHRAEDFPAAIRKLLEHREQRATNLRRLGTRRCDIRSSEVTPL